MGDELFPRLFIFDGIPSAETILSLNGFHDFCDKEGNIIGVIDVLLQRNAIKEPNTDFTVHLLLPPVTSQSWYHYKSLPAFSKAEDMHEYFTQCNVKLVLPDYERYMDVSKIAPHSEDMDDIYNTFCSLGKGPDYIRLTANSDRIKLRIAAGVLGVTLVNMVE